jgi:hypothetical protein
MYVKSGMGMVQKHAYKFSMQYFFISQQLQTYYLLGLTVL